VAAGLTAVERETEGKERPHGPPTGQQVDQQGAERAGLARPRRRSHDEGLSPQVTRRLLAEAAGTFALTLVAAGAEVIAVASGAEVGHAARVTAPGLMVLALIYALGDVSGAHINPVVTLAFALRGVFPWARVPAYWLAQLAGAVGAAAFLALTFGRVAHLGATMPRLGVPASLAMEVVLTWLLVTVILGTATRHRIVGPNAAIAVGATVALCGLFAAPVSGASMNPARSLGPALVGATGGDGGSAAWQSVWIYVLGPIAGSVAAVLGMWLLKGSRGEGEQEAAGGDGARPSTG
jgi:aquaporin Z